MKKIFLLLCLSMMATITFAQFADTAALATYLRDTIKDRRPDKVTALQIQKSLLGIKSMLTPKAWSKNGNSSTIPGTDYIGPVDSVAFISKINNKQAFSLYPSGHTSFGYGANKYKAAYSLSSTNTSIGYFSHSKDTTYIPEEIDGVDTTPGYNIYSTYNTSIGFEAMKSVGGVSRNTAIGYQAMKNATNSNNTAIGSGAMIASNGLGNVGIGVSALANSSSYNTAVGYETLMGAGAQSNTAIGYQSLKNTTGAGNIGIGASAMELNTTGANNLAIGNSALKNNISSSDNIAIGNSALLSHKTNSANIAIGSGALSSDTSGVYNTAVGFNSMIFNLSGEQNTAVGVNSLLYNTTGIKNNAFGAGSLENNISGSFNSGLGHDALLQNTTGIENVGVGWLGWAQNRTGSYNVGVGNSSGRSIFLGSKNVFIGAGSGYTGNQNDTVNNCIAIGAGSYTTQSYQTVIGNIDSSFILDLYAKDTARVFVNKTTPVIIALNPGNVGIMQMAPNSALHTASFATGYRSKDEDYTLDESDFTVEIIADNKTITLPTASGIAGRIYTVKLTASGSVTGTVATTGGENIDGSPTYSLSAQWKYVTVQSNGGDWIIIGKN